MGKPFLKEFEGSGGGSRLIEALMSQSIVRDKDLAVRIARCLKLEEIPAGSMLIEQGASDTDLFLVLSGKFSVVVHGREVARKKAGEHIGEMAMVDPRTPRSASVIATTDAVVARIAERDFSALADRFPRLWRRIALELACRLRNESAADGDRKQVREAAEH